MICNVLPCELRLFWYSKGALNRHLANKLPTCCQKIFVKGSKRQLANKLPTCCQKIFVKGGKRQLANSRPTVFLGSCSSLLPFVQCHSCAKNDSCFLFDVQFLVFLTNMDKTMRNTHEGQHALIFCTVEVLLPNCLAKAMKD